MPMPATVGQLRTKVSEMEIGDYISLAYAGVSANTLGVFRFLGDATNPDLGYSEIPITGLSGAQGSTNGYFYLIKVAKGLLVADRVIQHSITWDNLNTRKVIQGLPWDAGNIIPTMTSNTSPSGVASASSIYSIGYDAWKAFNHTKTDTTGNDAWITVSGNPTGWIQYDFGSGIEKVITQYAISSRGGGGIQNQAPKTWQFQGSNDGVSWETLDTRIGESNWTSSATPETRRYSFVNKTAYRHYRLDITANNGHASVLSISELEMFETAGIIRSLTGGVAYADANGNKSAIYSDSLWPISNEYDKYIINFPIDKIEPGKTLNDIFHWSGVETWTQDTPMVSIATVDRRFTRGGTRQGSVNYRTSNSAVSQAGFRPVFSYKE